VTYPTNMISHRIVGTIAGAIVGAIIGAILIFSVACHQSVRQTANDIAHLEDGDVCMEENADLSEIDRERVCRGYD